jgi:RNA recognition motif-containing protein
MLQGHTNTRDADIFEMMIGGERYSLVPMPDPMKSTTVYVGNLCEFVQDHDLSMHFSTVSTLTTVPSCVVRKVNTQSMGYGFVSFPNVQEKEVCIHVYQIKIFNLG